VAASSHRPRPPDLLSHRQNIQSPARPLSFTKENFNDEMIPSLLANLNDQWISHHSIMKTLQIIGEIKEKSQLEKLFLNGAISSLRRLLVHDFHSIQEEAAFCLFQITSILPEDPNRLAPHHTPTLRASVKTYASMPLGMVLSQTDYGKLLHPLLNRLICDYKKLYSTTSTSMAIFTILSHYPKLSVDLLRFNVVERLLPLLHSPLRTRESKRENQLTLLLNLLKIFTILSRSELFPHYCPNLFIRSVREILTDLTASICDMPIDQTKDLETEVRLHAAICLENIANLDDLDTILHEECALQAMAHMFEVLPEPTLLGAVRAMLQNSHSISIIFDEERYDIILGTLLGGDVHSCDLIYQELRSRLSTETKKRNSPLLQIVTSDQWLKTLTNNLEFGSDSERQFILESLINIANSSSSRQKMLLSHGTVVVVLRLLKKSLNIIRRKTDLELTSTGKEIVSCDLVAQMRSLCLLLVIIAEHTESHGYIYILGGTDLLMDIFLDTDRDFISRKHAAITLAYFLSDEQLESHIRDIYPTPITAPSCSIVEENFDCLCLSDVVKARDKRYNVIDDGPPQTDDVDHGIAVALKSFLENDIYPWK
jgi:hypothetical protein